MMWMYILVLFYLLIECLWVDNSFEVVVYFKDESVSIFFRFIWELNDLCYGF